MEEQNRLDMAQQPIVPDPKSSGKAKKVLIILLILILLGGLGYAGYLLNKTKQAAKGLASQLTSLQEENAKLKEQAAQPEAPKEVTYEAEVGKFTLALDPKYAVIEELDGGAEGGSATQLTVALTTDTEGVIDANLGNKVSVRTINGNSFEEAVDAALSDSPEKTKLDETVTIDGATGEVYELSGLYESKAIFFASGGIFYQILADVDNEQTQAITDDIIEGFKFN
jgi:hypothetical protein